MNILICDDDKTICDDITTTLTKNKDYTLFVCYSGNDAITISKKHSVDLLIIDIELPDSNGIEIANKIYDTNQSLKVIYITAYGNKYFSKIYSDFTPHGYIDKPIQFNILNFFINQVYDEYLTNKMVLEISFNQKKNLIPIKNIIYLQSKKRLCEINTTKETYICYKKLSDITNELSNKFIRTHHSFIINKDYVSSYNKKQISLTNGDIVPISKTYLNEVAKKLI